MQSIDKLREWAESVINSCFTGMRATDVKDYCDEIEAEIERDYMRLPVDADGAPIHVGDIVGDCSGNKGAVQHIGLWDYGFEVVFEHRPGQFTCRAPRALTHRNAPTVEDVLREFAEDVRREVAELGWLNDGVYAEYADKLREVLANG